MPRSLTFTPDLEPTALPLEMSSLPKLGFPLLSGNIRTESDLGMKGFISLMLVYYSLSVEQELKQDRN